MRHPRFTPALLVREVERVTRRTAVRKVEGLMRAVVRMARQYKPIPRSKRKEYQNNWEYVLWQAVCQKYRRQGKRLGR